MARTIIGALLVLAGCTWPSREPEITVPQPVASPTAAPGDRTLRWAIDDPGSLLPADAVTTSERLLADAVFDGLTRWDADLAVVPAAAARWRTDDSGRTWTFTLRTGATFSDGTPVTADAFVAGWTATALGLAHHHLQDVVGYDDVRSGRSRTLSGVEAVGRRRVRVRLRTELMDFPAIAGHPALAPLPPAAQQEGFAERPVGNGPYRMAEPWARGRFVRLARVDETPADASESVVPPDELLFTVADPETAFLAFDQGRLDVVSIPPAAIDPVLETMPRAARNQRGPGFVHGDAAATTVLIVDTEHLPFRSRGARVALSQALQRDVLAAPALSGGAEPAATLVPPSVPGARLRACATCSFDPDAARDTFRRLGVNRLELLFPQDIGQERMASTIAGQLERVGVRAVVRTLPFPAFARALQQGEGGVVRLAWVLDYPTADNALYPLLHSTQRPPYGTNAGEYSSPALDRLLDRARSIVAPEQREDAYRAAEDLALDDMAVIPVLTHRRRLAIAERVRGLEWTPMESVDLRQVRLIESAR